MISEPEAGEQPEAFTSPEDLSGRQERRSGGRPGRRSALKAWWCAAAGAAVASAVWATALVLHAGDEGPDPSAYRLEGDLCRSAALTSLGIAVAPRGDETTSESGLLRHPALDQIRCTIPLGEDEQTGSWHTNNAVVLAAALHKKSDPAGEFEARQRVTDTGVVEQHTVKPVPELGDAAFLIAVDAGHSELRVRDGAIVLSMTLSVTHYTESDSTDASLDDEPEFPDQSEYWPAMINDMRQVLATVRR